MPTRVDRAKKKKDGINIWWDPADGECHEFTLSREEKKIAKVAGMTEEEYYIALRNSNTSSSLVMNATGQDYMVDGNGNIVETEDKDKDWA